MIKLGESKGTTVVELIVASGLFVVLISLASGAFIQTLRTQRVVTNLSSSLNDVAFVTEQIAREVRTGFGFSTVGTDTLNFTNAAGDSVTYELFNSKIRKCVGVNCRNLTGDEVTIENIEFILQGTLPGDGEPPRVTILITVLSEKEIRVNMQTTISSRVLDS